MNLIEIAQKLKHFTDEQLLQAMQRPSGTTPGYLVMSELNRRKEARPNNPPKTTVMQDLAEMMPQQIPMGQMPGGSYKKGGKVEAGPSELERIARARQQEADTQAYWAEMIPESDVLGAKVISDYSFNPPVTMDERQYATRRALNLGPFSGLRNMRFDDQVREGLSDAPGVYGMTDANVATRGNPTVFISPKNMINYAGGVGTQNHEFGHVALTPIRESFEKDNRMGAIPLEHMVINAMRAQTGLSKEDKDYAIRQLQAHGDRLNHYGRAYKGEYAKKAGDYIDWLQGQRPQEPQHRNGVLNSMPYRRVDTAIMRKDIDKYAHGGIVSLQYGGNPADAPVMSDYDEFGDGTQFAYDPFNPPVIPREKGVYQQRREKQLIDAGSGLPGPSLAIPMPVAPPPMPEPPAALRRPGEPAPTSVRVDQMRQLPAEQYDPWPIGKMPAAPSGAAPSTSGSAAPNPAASQSGDPIARHLSVLGRRESSNRYDATGKLVTYPGGKQDRAYGKYQVMGANIPSWTKEHLGVSMTPEEFLRNPEAQEKVARGQFEKYYKKFGNFEDAVAAWASGRPLSQSADDKDLVFGFKVKDYVAQHMKEAGVDTTTGSKVPPAVARGREDEKNFDTYMAKYANRDNPYAGLQKRLEEIEARRGSRKDTNLNMALINAGLGMMASKSPYPLVAAGEAGLNALKGYREDEKGLREDEMLHLSAAAKMKEAEIAYQRGDQKLAFDLMREANANRRHAETLREGRGSVANQFLLKRYESGLTEERDRRQARAKFVTENNGAAYGFLLSELKTKLKREPTQAEIESAIDARLGYGTRSATPGGTAKAATHRYEPGKGLVPVQ